MLKLKLNTIVFVKHKPLTVFYDFREQSDNFKNYQIIYIVSSKSIVYVSIKPADAYELRKSGKLVSFLVGRNKIVDVFNSCR